MYSVSRSVLWVYLYMQLTFTFILRAHLYCLDLMGPEQSFFRQILLFLSSEILIHHLCFEFYKYILHPQQIKGYSPLFNADSFRKFTHSERGGSHLEWTAFLCIFLVPAYWNSSPTPIIMMPYYIHQNSPSVVPSTPKRRGMHRRSLKGKQKGQRTSTCTMYQLAVRNNQTRRKKTNAIQN